MKKATNNNQPKSILSYFVESIALALTITIKY